MTEHVHEIAHPHDRLARHFLTDPELTADLLTHYIEDTNVISLLDLKRLRCESPINVDKNLAQVIGDIRFSTVFKQTQRQSNVFVFIEHQSTVDDLMSFRALEQVVKSYRDYINTTKKNGTTPKSFPCPLVVILYHGKNPWGTLKRMRDLVDSVPSFPKDLLDFPIFLIDLSRIPPEQLKGHPALQALLETLQLGSEERLEAGFDRVASRLTAVRNDPRATGWMTALVKYAVSLCRIGQDAIYNAFSKILNEKEAQKMVMSTAQEWRCEGELKGKKDSILDFLSARFGKVPKEIQDTVNSYSDLTALQSLSILAGTCESLDDFKDGLR